MLGKDYESRVEHVLQYLGSNEGRHDNAVYPAPFCIEFAGTPDAGKTTIGQQLYQYFKRAGFRVICPQEGPEVIQHISRKTPLYNLRTAMYSLQNLIDFAAGSRFDLVILDRGPSDSYCWMEYWHKKEQINEAEKLMYQEFLMSRFWMQSINCVNFMTCSPAVAMKRDSQIPSLKREGGSTSPRSLEMFLDIWTRGYQELSAKRDNMHFLDTTNMTLQEVTETIFGNILLSMEQVASKHPRP